jgi:hypothetical protein
MKVKRHPRPVPRDNGHHGPKVPHGGWNDVLNDTTGVHTVVLDNGAFQWLWELVENKAQQAQRMVENPRGRYSPDFLAAYSEATFRVRDAFRDTASGKTIEKAIHERRMADLAEEEAALEAATAPPPAAVSTGRVKKVKIKKKRV